MSHAIPPAPGTDYTSVAILIVAALTLLAALATLRVATRPAKLSVTPFVERDSDDLLFFVYPQPNPDGVPQVPRDYLLQLRVVVANVGGRKAVLSSISIEHFKTESGKTMYLPESVQGPIWGMQWDMRTGYVGTDRLFEQIASPGPWVLATDDAIVVQFRTRRGIDWTVHRWDINSLRTFYEEVSNPFVSARVAVAWRRGQAIVRQHFDIDLRVLQQELYANALKDLTSDFTLRPAVDPIQFQIE